MQQSQPNRKEKEGQEKDYSVLNNVLGRNIRTIIHLRTKAMKTKPEDVLAEIHSLQAIEPGKR